MNHRRGVSFCKKQRAQLRRRFAGEDMAMTLRRAIPDCKDLDQAETAIRLVMRGFSIAHASRECRLPTPVVSSYVNRFTSYALAWMDGRKNA
ncbi:MAG: hypothetical protein JSS51_03485 [Planctomycetes bacterium]|nr:hypothetical protein [Planctomycetota bacterium]